MATEQGTLQPNADKSWMDHFTIVLTRLSGQMGYEGLAGLTDHSLTALLASCAPDLWELLQGSEQEVIHIAREWLLFNKSGFTLGGNDGTF